MLKRLYFFLFMVVLAVSLVFSIFFSSTVQSFFLRLWYCRPGAQSVETIVQNHYTSEMSKDKFVTTSKTLFRTFPSHKAVKLLYARALVIEGLNIATALKIFEQLVVESPADIEILREYISLMYDEKYYPDIVTFIGHRKDEISDPEVLRIYGISLYYTNNFEKAITVLAKSLGTLNVAETAYYMALCYEKYADSRQGVTIDYYRKSLFYMESAKNYAQFQNSDYIRIMKKADRKDSLNTFLRSGY